MMPHLSRNKFEIFCGMDTAKLTKLLQQSDLLVGQIPLWLFGFLY